MNHCTRGHPLTGKRGCDECRRENLLRQPPPGPKPLAALRPRKAKRKSNAKLSRQQIAAIWQLHRDGGYSVAAIVRRGWRTWGYSSEAGALSSVYASLRLDGTPAGGLCAGCSCHLDERTRGCLTCKNRHKYRRWRNKEAARPSEERRAA